MQKLIEVTLPVPDAIGFSADLERSIAATIRATCVGRCLGGAYVLRLLEVVRASRVTVELTNTTGHGYIDVQFRAAVRVFSRWDILVGVRVRSTEQMVVGLLEHGSAPVAVSFYAAAEATKVLRMGQLVPARIIVAEHGARKPQVAAVAVVLTCDLAAPVYRVAGALAPGDARAELAPMLAAVDAELAARAELAAGRRADLWFFEALLYSYRLAGKVDGAGKAGSADQKVATGAAGAAAWWEGPAGLPLPAGAAPRDILDIVRRAVAGEAVAVDGYWARPLALYRSSPLAAHAASNLRAKAEQIAAPDGWAFAATDSPPRVVFAELLRNVLDFLVATRELAEVYNTRELIDAHLNIWTAMRAAQIPAELRPN